MATARPSALLLVFALAAPCLAGAAEIGTLFHSAEERARLDKLRRGEPEALAIATPARREVTGFVRRSDGRGTVWINGVPVTVADSAARELFDPQKVRTPGRGDVKVERTREPAVKR